MCTQLGYRYHTDNFVNYSRDEFMFAGSSLCILGGLKKKIIYSLGIVNVEVTAEIVAVAYSIHVCQTDNLIKLSNLSIQKREFI